MAKFKNKVVASFLIGAMLVGSISGVSTFDNTKTVYAQSQELKNAKDKVNQLIDSLHKNSLELKNKDIWDKYIDESYNLIWKSPESEASERELLDRETFRCIMVVDSLIGVANAEKSILSGDNSKIENVQSAKEYLYYGERYLQMLKYSEEELMKTPIFQKQYNELISRKEKVEAKITEVEGKFEIEYNKALKLFEEAKKSGDKDQLENVLKEVEKLGKCPQSNSLRLNVKRVIEGKNEVKFTNFNSSLFSYGYSFEVPDTFENITKQNLKCETTFGLDKMKISATSDNDLLFEDLEEYYYKNIYDDIKGEVIINNLEEDFVEVEYIDNGVVTYIKIDAGAETKKILHITYPESEYKNYKDIMDYVSNSFRTPYINIG